MNMSICIMYIIYLKCAYGSLLGLGMFIIPA